MQGRNDYLLSQPELQDPSFVKIIDDGLAREKENPHERFILSWELFKYRINKNIPASLPFDERKKRFVNSREWNGIIRMNNHHLSEEQLTPQNIQAEIDNAGILAGMEIEKQFMAVKMQKALYEGNCELVLDKGNIKYKN